MKEAFSQAKIAASQGEVPVGAVIVSKGRIIASAYNKREQHQIATHHAELLAIEAANQALCSWRLIDCELYVTLEPCLMCAGAILGARVKKVYFSCRDPKAGALTSLYSVHDDTRLNHRFAIDEGLLATESSALLKDFFRARRLAKDKPH